MAPFLYSDAESHSAVRSDWNAPSESAAPESSAHSFADVYRKYFNDVCRWVRAMGGPEAERDDLIQDVFLVVHRRLPYFQGDNLSGWIYQITRHRVRDFRRLRWFRLFLSSTPADEALVSSSEGPETAFGNRQKEQLLRRLLSKLPESQRSAFMLFELEGYSGDEIANLQQVPINTVRARIYRARAKLASEVQRLRESRDGSVERLRPDNT